MKYINELGIISNLKRVFLGVSDTNKMVCNNHAETKELVNEDENALIEVTEVMEECSNAIVDLITIIEEFTNAVTELTATLEEKEN